MVSCGELPGAKGEGGEGGEGGVHGGGGGGCPTQFWLYKKMQC